MEDPQHERLFVEFDRLCDLPGGERRRSLAQLEADDPAFAEQLVSLLRVDHRADTAPDPAPPPAASPLTAAVWKMASAAVEPDRVGTRIGRFMLLERIGQGGMGVVYSAFDNELERRVAVKLIRALAPDPREQARLLREARAMAKLAHPNVVTVFEAGTVDNGHGDEVFVAMEYVKGETLRAWARRTPRHWREVVAMYSGAARGLAAAHAAGLVHRDFKPDNVLVGADLRPRVLDFGLARPGTDRDPEAASSSPRDSDHDVGAPAGNVDISAISEDGVALGTPGYMAAEQIDGSPVDHRSDQFAFCVSLYEALYAERPYVGETFVELFVRIKEGTISPLPVGTRVPGWLRAIVLRGLDPRPQARWPSMDALLEALARDPARARTNLMLGAAGLTALGVATWSGSLLVGGEVAPCRDAASQLEQVWDDGQREAVRGALPAEVAEAVVPVFDQYARAWIDGHTEACEATRVRGEQSTERLDHRMQCLTRKRRELAVVIDQLAAAEPNAVANALARARGLSSVAACADPEYLAAQRVVSPGTAARLRGEELREELATAKSCVIAYDEPGFGGQSWTFCPGIEPPVTAVWDDRISSIRVPDGLEARLCTDPGFRGRCLTLLGDAAWLAGDLPTATGLLEGFDDRISSVQWDEFDAEGFSLLAFDAGPDTDPAAYAALEQVGATIADRLAGVVVDIPATSLGTPDRWSRFDERFARRGGLHLWPAWRHLQGPAEGEAACFAGPCGPAAFTFLEHAIGGAQPLRFDAMIEQTYGMLQRGRTYRGSLAYSWSVGEYRFIQLHERIDIDYEHTHWNSADALTERLQLHRARQWLEDELGRARRGSESAVVLVGELDSTLIEVVELNPDIAAVVARAPRQHDIDGVPVLSRSPSAAGMFVQIDFDPHRITAYDVVQIDGELEHVDLWHLDVPRGYRPASHAVLAGNNRVIVEHQTKGQCAAACDAASQFECVSFDYNTRTGHCHLAVVGSDDVEASWNRPPWLLYERSAVPEDFTLYPDAALVGHNTHRIPELTVSQCLAACRAERAFVCRSVDYQRSQGLCDLSETSVGERGLSRPYANYDHFERNDVAVPSSGPMPPG